MATYDTAYKAVREVIDMPDRRASMFVKFYMQNKGSISKRKRALFDELSDEDIKDLEAAIRYALNPDAPDDNDEEPEVLLPKSGGKVLDAFCFLTSSARTQLPARPQVHSTSMIGSRT
ncbi:hypothetical protein [Rhizobium sp. RHZ01]|uniref:hypothetical protein n=1 Tax=Rhizobium sp. RHZ01 TaxID=2769304 RepID=UPI00177C9F67|nr:hypothetical protein [Rhizobium sp. RHZ01]MBD9449712.1 hypothetical protein [Rhizobium sp. RHZ01]